ncbi:MAG: thiol:disulfide interchange protein DsbA/DsbL [Steroidobacteraceae bacterium]|jgi:thiol:disulfide interchange protein DsbA
MRASRLGLLLYLTLTLAACGKHQAASEHRSLPTRAQPPAVAAPAASASTAAPRSAVEATPKTLRPNQDGSETMEESAGDNGTHNALLAAVASTVAAATPAAYAQPLGPTLWQPGVNYTLIVPAQPTSVPAGQVEVLEFFWYACPHCYDLDPQIEAWRKSKPAYISFSRVPVTWSDGHRALARLFYTLKSLGKLDQLHDAVFKEIHVNGNPLVAADGDEAETERIQTAFAKKQGIADDEFKKAYHSFSVDADLQKADALVQRYRIDGVPSFVINGKYVADVRTAGTPERLMSLVGDLAAQEHKH